ncbi:Ycf34 family protein [Kovacikia minuta CCNUW1]|nr:Ycf34 family protein [Kovacikia minuta]UBF26756.1 Ycf34 family protein [Kovacikia minuta CCNUW1]
MCICVNCHYVDRCTTYYEVERLHQQRHLTETPDFEAVNPTINYNLTLPEYSVSEDGQVVEGGEFREEYDVVGCESFLMEKGKWAKLRPGELIPT